MQKDAKAIIERRTQHSNVEVPDMTFSTVAVVASGDPILLNICLLTLARQNLQDTIVLPWGNKSPEVRKIAERFGAIIIEYREDKDEDRTLESHRNVAIRYIKEETGVPDYVLFLDDDTVLSDNWHRQMLASRDEVEICYATVVAFSKYQDTIQSAGHCFEWKGRPHDLWYRRKVASIPLLRQDLSLFRPLCPCANCALIPWKAIGKIQAKDSNVWDPRFERWQTCFDFGLKLRLLGYGCKLVEASMAYHRGYQERCFEGSLGDEDFVFKQLRSRILLYLKFFPPDEFQEAINSLKETVRNKWAKEGYPCADPKTRSEISRIYARAEREADKLFRKNENTMWLDLVKNLEKRTRKSLLLGA
jgi:glycosyltransferase involved in cell wall biosynthesis